jgi:hypothetical protein
MDYNNPKNIAAIIESGEGYYEYNLDNLPQQQNKVVIAVTSLTRTNNESLPDQYIYLEKKSNGWHVQDQRGY